MVECTPIFLSFEHMTMSPSKFSIRPSFAPLASKLDTNFCFGHIELYTYLSTVIVKGAILPSWWPTHEAWVRANSCLGPNHGVDKIGYYKLFICKQAPRNNVFCTSRSYGNCPLVNLLICHYYKKISPHA